MTSQNKPRANRLPLLLDPGLRGGSVAIGFRTIAFRPMGFHMLGFRMVDRRNVRLGDCSCEGPRLAVTSRQHQVETAARGSGSPHPINAVARFQSARGEV